MKQCQINKLEKAILLLDESFSIIETIAQQERINYELMPTVVQNSKRGEKLIDTFLSLEQHLVDLESVIDSFQSIKSNQLINQF